MTEADLILLLYLRHCAYRALRRTILVLPLAILLAG